MNIEITKDEYLKALGTVVAYEQQGDTAKPFTTKQEYPNAPEIKEKKEEIPDKD